LDRKIESLCLDRYGEGWDTLYNTIFPNELPADLTQREHEVALLAADLQDAPQKVIFIQSGTNRLKGTMFLDYSV
jgi:hypothetical protein